MHRLDSFILGALCFSILLNILILFCLCFYFCSLYIMRERTKQKYLTQLTYLLCRFRNVTTHCEIIWSYLKNDAGRTSYQQKNVSKSFFVAHDNDAAMIFILIIISSIGSVRYTIHLTIFFRFFFNNLYTMCELERIFSWNRFHFNIVYSCAPPIFA